MRYTPLEMFSLQKPCEKQGNRKESPAAGLVRCLERFGNANGNAASPSLIYGEGIDVFYHETLENTGRK